jgi:hypothetical protein
MRLTALLLVLASPATLAAGGTVVQLEGNASIVRKGSTVIVAESTPVYTGDTLKVADHSSAQVRFEDDSVFVLPGESSLRVDKFALGSGGNGGAALYTLLEGGVRTMTGKVSKGKGDRYELRTPEAIIGVEGTAYMAMRCTGACAKKYREGLYVRVQAGKVLVGTAASKTTIKAGQTWYVKNKESAAVRVKDSPFDDPVLNAQFNVSVEFEAEIHPPRIEPEPVPSPS